jgi:hypothetical protein
VPSTAPSRISGTPRGGACPGRHCLGHRVVRDRANVRHVHDPAFERHPPGDGVVTGDDGSLAIRRPELGLRCADRTRRGAVHLALAYEDRCGIDTAESDRGFNQRVQHRLHIGGRAADDVEHVTGRGLVFERLLEVSGAPTQFAKQPRILHGDDRLRREVLKQRDLLVRERTDLFAIDGQHTDQHLVFTQSDNEVGSDAGDFDQFRKPGLV